MNALGTFDLASLGRIFTSDINNWPGDYEKNKETINSTSTVKLNVKRVSSSGRLTLRTLRRIERHKRRRFKDKSVEKIGK